MNKFQVIAKSKTYNCFSPGDYITESFLIQNNSDSPLQVRLQNVSNIENSALYSVVQAGWITDNESISFHSLADITSNWQHLDGNSSTPLHLCLYFPKELGNYYQNKRLEACFTFEGRCLNSEITGQQNIVINTSPQMSDSSTNTVLSPPPTGDTSYIGSVLISGLLYLLLFVFLHHKRKGT